MCVCLWNNLGLHGGAVGWDTALQAGSWRFRFPTVSLIFQAARFDSVSNRNEYQEYLLGSKGGRCLGLTLPFSCTDCLEVMEASTSWSPQVLSRDYFTVLLLCKIELKCRYPRLCLTILLFLFTILYLFIIPAAHGYVLCSVYRHSPVGLQFPVMTWLCFWIYMFIVNS